MPRSPRNGAPRRSRFRSGQALWRPVSGTAVAARSVHSPWGNSISPDRATTDAGLDVRIQPDAGVL